MPGNAEDIGWISGSGKSPGEEHGNPLQYSYLENPMDGGAWWRNILYLDLTATTLYSV